jgi:hypothetical protein
MVGTKRTYDAGKANKLRMIVKLIVLLIVLINNLVIIH